MSINLKQIPDGSAGLEGTDSGLGTFIYVNIPYNTTSPLTLSGAVLPRRCVVQSVLVNPDVSSTNAVTVSAFKAANTVALGSGVALTSAGAALNGTAGTNVVGALSAVGGALDCAALSRVGVVISGALGAAGSGVITIALNPA